ncbi:MAG: serine hydroxymethyltransferase [Candidatus Shapirobacteria bacterium]
MLDPIFELIKQEERRQKETLMLIPSENYAWPEVLVALGSCLTNKYAEGYPGKRYYQGNTLVDEIENLAIARAKKLFGTPHANVQPYSGSPANQAVYLATCQVGERVLGMELAAGGHLTHGAKVSFAGRFYQASTYGVSSKDNCLDYEAILSLAKRVKPKLVWAGATAYPRLFDWAKFSHIAQSVGAYLAADISHYAGLIAGGVYPSPVKFVDLVTTTTHKTLRGPRGAIIMVTAKGLWKDSDLAQKIDRAVFPGLQGGPHVNNIAAMAIALRKAQSKDFKAYAWQVVKNAQALAAELIKLGFDLVTGGTDNHLLLIDLRRQKINGQDAAVKLERAGIVVNANAIPFDPNPPRRPSGLRLGTPAVTALGLKEKEMISIARRISRVLQS